VVAAAAAAAAAALIEMIGPGDGAGTTERSRRDKNAGGWSEFYL
jgi:hypothetical protein